MYQTLCAFSQIKDTKHIRRDFHLLPGVRLWGAGGAQGGGQKIQPCHVAYQIDKDDEQNRIQTGDLRGEVKRSNTINGPGLV